MKHDHSVGQSDHPRSLRRRSLLEMTKICVALSALCLLAVQLCAAEPPLIVAHRGLLLHAPENTLANFRACLELRLGFEFDVEKTKDGHLVCIHDGTVDRTANGTGKEVGINGVLTLRPNRMSTAASFSSRPGRNPKRSKQNQDQHGGRILGHCHTTQHAGTH